MKRSGFSEDQIVGVLKEAEAGVPGKDLCRRVGMSDATFYHQVTSPFIERGKPTQNAFIESFNGKFRDECLNQNWFADLRHACKVIEALGGVDYNTVSPHSSLGYMTPEEFAASVAGRPASPPTPGACIVPAGAESGAQEPRRANL